MFEHTWDMLIDIKTKAEAWKKLKNTIWSLILASEEYEDFFV